MKFPWREMFGLSNFPNKLCVLHGCAHKSFSVVLSNLVDTTWPFSLAKKGALRWCLQGSRSHWGIWFDSCPSLSLVLSAVFCALQVPRRVCRWPSGAALCGLSQLQSPSICKLSLATQRSCLDRCPADGKRGAGGLQHKKAVAAFVCRL